MALLTGQLRCRLKYWYTGGDPEQGFWCCSADELNQKFMISSICGTGYEHSYNKEGLLKGIQDRRLLF